MPLPPSNPTNLNKTHGRVNKDDELTLASRVSLSKGSMFQAYHLQAMGAVAFRPFDAEAPPQLPNSRSCFTFQML